MSPLTCDHHCSVVLWGGSW